MKNNFRIISHEIFYWHMSYMQQVKLLRHVSDQDIKIHDLDVKFTDKRQAGYNLGDLLNMPYLSDVWGETTGRETMYSVAHTCKGSILNMYCRGKPKNETVPNIPRLVNSVQQYMKENQHHLHHVLNLARDDDCLCVHVRSGDLEVSSKYVRVIKDLSKRFRTVIILGGVHLDQHFRSHQEKIQNFKREMNQILAQGDNLYFYPDVPDVHLCLMRVAKHLLVHHGGFSALGAIVSTGQLYVTSEFNHVMCHNWVNIINKKYQLV
jgi:hypothetical protein